MNVGGHGPSNSHTRFLPRATDSRPQLLILFHPAMSGEKLRLTCLLWPDKPNEHLVEVEFVNSRTDMFLKKLIKDKHARSLARVDARTVEINCPVSSSYYHYHD